MGGGWYEAGQAGGAGASSREQRSAASRHHAESSSRCHAASSSQPPTLPARAPDTPRLRALPASPSPAYSACQALLAEGPSTGWPPWGVTRKSGPLPSGARRISARCGTTSPPDAGVAACQRGRVGGWVPQGWEGFIAALRRRLDRQAARAGAQAASPAQFSAGRRRGTDSSAAADWRCSRKVRSALYPGGKMNFSL